MKTDRLRGNLLKRIEEKEFFKKLLGIEGVFPTI